MPSNFRGVRREKFLACLKSTKSLQYRLHHGGFARLRPVVIYRVFLIILFFTFGSVAVAQTASPVRSTPLLTVCGENVTADNVHTEYPRPTLLRSDWLNLNGYWDWRDGNEQREGFTHRILVPFPPESTLSGVGRFVERCVYRRTFTIPQHWNEEDRVLLHFGAVDWEATVFINGQEVGTHRGGYTPFVFDITSFIHRSEPNEIVVHVFDPSQRGEQPRGKQSTTPGGIWYTASTGIWQTVWLEPVPQYYIKTLRIQADFNTGRVTIVPILNTPNRNLTVVAEAFDGNESVAKSYGGSDGTLMMHFDRFRIKPWSPDSPHLYDIRVQLLDRGNPVDTVASYFAFRKIELVRDDNGYPRVYLNGKRLFLMGVVDQGYWPDGLYTAPSDSAQLTDILVAKSMGFNVIRKYQKIEPERWYFLADYRGILVWQDMPSGENRSPAAQEQFRKELQRMIQTRSHHPSIMTWTIFNEGAGQHKTNEYVELVRHLDQTRLVNAASGWTDFELGSVSASHRFPGTEMPPPDVNRLAVIGLFGGLTLVPDEENRWGGATWAYQGGHVSDWESLVRRYEQMHEELRRFIRTQGLAGAFFHQLTDIETECNGLMPYDRRILKVPAETMEQINRETIRIGSE